MEWLFWPGQRQGQISITSLNRGMTSGQVWLKIELNTF
jgi:hypothetical protein